MKTTAYKRLFSRILCLVLTCISALAVGCTDNNRETPMAGSGAAGTSGDQAETLSQDGGVTKLGNGKTVFKFTVVDGSGNEAVFEIATDKDTVGDALKEHGLLEGEDGPYGLYVKKVSGITADYDKTGTYWAFYENGEYAMAGVDKTKAVSGAAYSFKVEK